MNFNGERNDDKNYKETNQIPRPLYSLEYNDYWLLKKRRIYLQFRAKKNRHSLGHENSRFLSFIGDGRTTITIQKKQYIAVAQIPDLDPSASLNSYSCREMIL